MKCFACDSDKAHAFFVEEIECSHCNEIIKLTYLYCESCGMVWKDNDGVPAFSLDIKELTDPDKVMDMMNAIKGFEERVNDDSSISNYIHRCIRCNSICYEVNKGMYKCSDKECGFEWEIVKCG